MKAFKFRLERVLSWRGTELAIAEAKAEQLLSGLRSAEEKLVQLSASRVSALAALAQAASVSGTELGVLETTRIWAIREEQRLTARKLELLKSIEEQERRVAEARRAVKLVERLRERRYDKWQAETAHELEELSGESAIAQWRRLQAESAPRAVIETERTSPAPNESGR